MDISAILDLFADPSRYQNTTKFQAIVLFVIVVGVIAKVWGSNSQGVFVILATSFALFLMNAYIKISSDDLNDFNKTTFIKLQTLQGKVNEYLNTKIESSGISGIQLSDADRISLVERNKLDALYTDSTMVYFLYSILPLYEYNKSEFYLLVKGTNNILKIRKQIEDYYQANTSKTPDPMPPKMPSFQDDLPVKSEPVFMENIHEMFEIAIQLKINCLNNIQNIIYDVPKVNKMYKYIDDVQERYSVLISRNLAVINKYHLLAIKETGINTRTKYVYYNGTKGYDRMSNQNIIPTKDLGVRAELHQFYV